MGAADDIHSSKSTVVWVCRTQQHAAYPPLEAVCEFSDTTRLKKHGNCLCSLSGCVARVKRFEGTDTTPEVDL